MPKPIPTPIQFRLSVNELELIDRIRDHLGAPGLKINRIQVVRRALYVLAEQEGLLTQSDGKTRNRD